MLQDLLHNDKCVMYMYCKLLQEIRIKKQKYFDPNRTLCFCFKIVYMDFMVKTAAEHAASFVRTIYAIKLRAPVWKDV